LNRIISGLAGVCLPGKYSKVLVTGGAGFIGSHVADSFVDSDFEVVVIDNLSSGRLENIKHNMDKKDFRLAKVDIRDYDSVKKLVKDVDAVFHEAAVVSVTRSVENPFLTNDVNVTGTLNLLKASVDSGVKRFVYASSSSVYGETKTLPKHEGLAPQPISPYAVSKMAAERYCLVFHEVYGLETVCLRYFNVYGPRQKYGPYSGVISIFINRLLNDEPPIIFGDGEQTRDFTHVQNVVQASKLALNKSGAVGEVFNIAAGVATTVNELASMLLEIMDKTYLKPVYTSPRPGDIRHSYADVTKAKKVLGYHPTFSLKEGLSQLVKWYRSNPSSRSP